MSGSTLSISALAQDFLGPSQPAKTFIDKYIAYRFQNVPTSSAPASTPSFKPSGVDDNTRSGRPNAGNAAKAQHSHTAPASQPASRDRSPIPSNFNDAFGQSGKGYQKNIDADQDMFGRYTPSPSGSGANTPDHSRRRHPQIHQDARPGGFLTVHQVAAVHKQHDDREKGKGKENKIWDLPRSKDVRKLDVIREKLLEVQASMGKLEITRSIHDCFCQGEH